MKNTDIYEHLNDEAFEFEYPLVNSCGVIGLFIQSSKFGNVYHNNNRILFIVVYKNESYILESFDVLTPDIMDMCEDTFRNFLKEKSKG